MSKTAKANWLAQFYIPPFYFSIYIAIISLPTTQGTGGPIPNLACLVLSDLSFFPLVYQIIITTTTGYKG